MESELHAVLKELIRLNGQASRPNQAALFKQLFRLSLTQRELYGTGLLAQLTAEWETRRELDAAARPSAHHLNKRR